MARKKMTDEEVERQIAALEKDPLVTIGKVKYREDNKRRQRLYNLQAYRKKGEAYAKELGLTDADVSYIIELIEAKGGRGNATGD